MKVLLINIGKLSPSTQEPNHSLPYTAGIIPELFKISECASFSNKLVNPIPRLTVIPGG